ncbi:SDR family oxidoreductase [Streptomyces albus subsp. chlorinus]|uniref:SDR family oxidoreductase n=1 Tax=Streptomyces albus TaxID=1888 RepID=UPI00156FD567|nr:SDR family oxidoreductase [Streptomyces albus]NSC20020.1 SDR family oxidoreductase [Streptomyces albus subsp. chlorinus]
MTHTDIAHGRRPALVAGAARGIGAAVARRPAHDGLAVGATDLDGADRADTVAAITGAGGVAAAVAADVWDEASVTAAVARVADELGPWTVLAGNAGIGARAGLVARTAQRSVRRLGGESEEFRRGAARSIPAGRVGGPEDVAHTASFPVSPEAGFVSGQVVHVADGPVGRG